MGIWIRTQDRKRLIEIVGVGVKETKSAYFDTIEIVGLNKSLNKERLRTLQNNRKSIKNPGRNTKQARR